RAIFNRGRPDERALGKIHELHVRKGDTVTMEMPGGAGFGAPFLRDTEAVLSDVRRGFVSRESAERDYGVAIEKDQISTTKTAELRRRQSNEKPAQFIFAPERAAWDKIFSDARMRQLNDHLYALPKVLRHEVRSRVFEAAVPGISAPNRPPLMDLAPDFAAAAARLDQALAELTASGA